MNEDRNFIFSTSEKLPKSQCSYRTIKLPAFVWDELMRRKTENQVIVEKTGRTDGLEYVSVSWHGKIKDKNTVPSLMNKICKRNNIQHLTLHSLRHFAGSMLIESGVEISLVAQFLGHKSVNTTLDIYAYLIESDDLARKLLNQLDPLGVSNG